MGTSSHEVQQQLNILMEKAFVANTRFFAKKGEAGKVCIALMDTPYAPGPDSWRAQFTKAIQEGDQETLSRSMVQRLRILESFSNRLTQDNIRLMSLFGQIDHVYSPNLGFIGFLYIQPQTALIRYIYSDADSSSDNRTHVSQLTLIQLNRRMQDGAFRLLASSDVAERSIGDKAKARTGFEKEFSIDVKWTFEDLQEAVIYYSRTGQVERRKALLKQLLVDGGDVLHLFDLGEQAKKADTTDTSKALVLLLHHVFDDYDTLVIAHNPNGMRMTRRVISLLLQLNFNLLGGITEREWTTHWQWIENWHHFCRLMEGDQNILAFHLESFFIPNCHPGYYYTTTDHSTAVQVETKWTWLPEPIRGRITPQDLFPPLLIGNMPGLAASGEQHDVIYLAADRVSFSPDWVGANGSFLHIYGQVVYSALLSAKTTVLAHSHQRCISVTDFFERLNDIALVMSKSQATADMLGHLVPEAGYGILVSSYLAGSNGELERFAAWKMKCVPKAYFDNNYTKYMSTMQKPEVVLAGGWKVTGEAEGGDDDASGTRTLPLSSAPIYNDYKQYLTLPQNPPDPSDTFRLPKKGSSSSPDSSPFWQAVWKDPNMAVGFYYVLPGVVASAVRNCATHSRKKHVAHVPPPDLCYYMVDDKEKEKEKTSTKTKARTKVAREGGEQYARHYKPVEQPTTHLLQIQTEQDFTLQESRSQYTTIRADMAEMKRNRPADYENIMGKVLLLDPEAAEIIDSVSRGLSFEEYLFKKVSENTCTHNCINQIVLAAQAAIGVMEGMAIELIPLQVSPSNKTRIVKQLGHNLIDGFIAGLPQRERDAYAQFTMSLNSSATSGSPLELISVGDVVVRAHPTQSTAGIMQGFVKPSPQHHAIIMERPEEVFLTKNGLEGFNVVQYQRARDQFQLLSAAGLLAHWDGKFQEKLLKHLFEGDGTNIPSAETMAMIRDDLKQERTTVANKRDGEIYGLTSSSSGVSFRMKVSHSPQHPHIWYCDPIQPERSAVGLTPKQEREEELMLLLILLSLVSKARFLHVSFSRADLGMYAVKRLFKGASLFSVFVPLPELDPQRSSIVAPCLYACLESITNHPTLRIESYPGRFVVILDTYLYSRELGSLEERAMGMFRDETSPQLSPPPAHTPAHTPAPDYSHMMGEINNLIGNVAGNSEVNTQHEKSSDVIDFIDDLLAGKSTNLDSTKIK